MSYANIFPAKTVVNAENTENKFTKLIYRGQVYQYLPQTAKKLIVSEVRKVQLIYRGQTYNCVTPVAPAARPNAINWRFQVA